MKNIDLAKKIKELRARKGFSQDQLAETAQINLRTVQRIESGETEPRGDTLKRLASALNITPDELIDWTEQEDNSFLAFFNLSALSFILFPLLGIIVPLAIWFLKKDKIRYLNENGKSLINFQITWSIVYFLPSVFISAAFMFHWHLGISLGVSEVMYMAYASIAFYAINILFIAINSYRTYKGKKAFYMPAIPFLR